MRRALLALALLAGCSRAPVDDGATLTFSRDGTPQRTLSRGQLIAVTKPVTVTAFDPYYQRQKSYRAVPLRDVLRAGFGSAPSVADEYVVRARDGYAVPMTGDLLLEDGGFLAIADEDAPGWEPIGPQRANPGPFYLVWSKPAQQDLEAHPRPWQVATFDVARFETVYPHTYPRNVPDGSPARRGFAIFRGECVRCHAMNREGGRVGPDLNVPRSIVEYRPVEQIRAYIRNPESFRYSNMPAHPSLGDDDLDALVAYFTAMKDEKYVPPAGK